MYEETVVTVYPCTFFSTGPGTYNNDDATSISTRALRKSVWVMDVHAYLHVCMMYIGTYVHVFAYNL